LPDWNRSQTMSESVEPGPLWPVGLEPFPRSKTGHEGPGYTDGRPASVGGWELLRQLAPDIVECESSLTLCAAFTPAKRRQAAVLQMNPTERESWMFWSAGACARSTTLPTGQNQQNPCNRNLRFARYYPQGRKPWRRSNRRNPPIKSSGSRYASEEDMAPCLGQNGFLLRGLVSSPGAS
jgi:hypothetical protein